MQKTELTAPYHHEFLQIIRSHTELMQLLQVLADLAPEAYLAAGVIRNSIWSHLHGQNYAIAGTEVDVIYHLSTEQQDEIQQKLTQQLTQQFPMIEWDVTNQARVHTWYRRSNGEGIAALVSNEEALLGWPETATALAVRLTQQGEIEYLAPFGLSDVFELKLRWNAKLVSYHDFEQRMQKKNWLLRWPKLRLICPE